MTALGEYIEKRDKEKLERLRHTIAKGRALGQQKQETPGKSKGGRKLGHQKQKKSESLLSDEQVAAYQKQYKQLASQGKDTTALKAQIKQAAYKAYVKRNGGIDGGAKAMVGKLMSTISGAGGERALLRRKGDTETAAGRIAGRRKKKR